MRVVIVHDATGNAHVTTDAYFGLEQRINWAPGRPLLGVYTPAEPVERFIGALYPLIHFDKLVMAPAPAFESEARSRTVITIIGLQGSAPDDAAAVLEALRATPRPPDQDEPVPDQAVVYGPDNYAQATGGWAIVSAVC